MVAVVNAAQARDVITRPDGLLAGAHRDLIIVLLSTVALQVVQELAAHCASVQVDFLDCGVTPGNKAAENGMVAMVGGEHAVVERAQPVLSDWARKVVHCGPLGAGMATKIARNVITYGSWRTVAEASALAEAAGVDPAKLLEVIDAADPEGNTLLQLLRLRNEQGALPEVVARQIEPLMTKDLAAAHELAATLGVDAPLIEVVMARAKETLGLSKEPQPPQGTAWERGLEMMDRVYGPGSHRQVTEAPMRLPFGDLTVEHLFAEIWSRPGLSIRDRRLLVLGATAALGRADLIQVQVQGALANHELTVEQLHEMVVHLAYYTGWGNATAVLQGVAAALTAAQQETNTQVG
jgi:3-hydroxyisobutyrate dehydrogenase-like beta-hydroxyacid dehydrogenase/alkylhydroperoxidase/carboxymuconolactone decarboxylase family protein YurZ